jgi:multidrug efflux pump subunit AcrA (membrane-fusion protein)
MTLTDLSQLQITCTIAEADVSKIQVGQPAVITLNAITTQKFTGTVVSVGTSGTSSSGVVTYPVTLDLVDPTSQVLAGMSASVSIVTQQVDDVLVVPSSAVTSVGKTGSVTVVSGSKQTRVPVVIALAGSSTTGVYGNLKVGDKVLLPTVTITPNTSSSGTGTLGGSTTFGGGLGRLSGGGGFGGFGGGGGSFSFRSGG